MSFYVIFFVFPILESAVILIMFKISEEPWSNCGILANFADESWPRLLGSDSFSNEASKSLISIDGRAVIFDDFSILGKLAFARGVRLLGSDSFFKLASKSLISIDEKAG